MMFRKVFALLMTLVLMLGMAPVGHAEGGNMMPGGDFTVICNHNWEWRWPNGKPAHCQEWKRCEEYCTKCGAAGDSFEQCGECQPGSWHWDGNPPANCNEWSIQNQSCSVCDEIFNEREVRGDHKWSGYTIVEPAGCETPGEEANNCTVCGEKGSSREIPPKGHDWGAWKWEVEAACNQDGLRVRYCNRCNMREEEYAQGGEHKWGKWQTDKPATCTEGGTEKRTCSVCGQPQTRNTDPLGHSFGSWEETQAPTCMAEGRRKHVCTRCGHTEWSNIPKVDHLFGAWYVVTPAQVGVAGLEQRDCTYGCGTYEQREIPPLKEGDSVPPAVELPTVVLEKHVMNAPANGEFYVPGEDISFGFTLWVYGPGRTKASSEFIVKEAIIYDPLKEDQIVMVDIDGTWNMGNAFLYTVTEEDARRGYIENTGYATWIYVENGQSGRVDSNTVTTPCGFDDSGDFGLTAGLSVTKKVTSTPANGSYYEPGEDITFVITVSNQGVGPLMNVNVIDPLGGGLVTVLETLNVGETRDITVVFTTTDIVAWAGSVDNGACVKAVDKDGRQYVEYSNIVTVPCGHTFLNVTITPPFGIFHSLAVVKKEESLPQNGQYYTEGEVIHYSITYTNDGELPLTDVQIWDVLNVTTPVASAEMLNPGESRVCYYQHTVTAEDVAAGSVMNVAHASYPAPNDAGFANSTSNVVISKTSADDNVWIVLPLFPGDGEEPEYDPGTGWFPSDPAPEGETPSFGTIDTDALHSGNNYCVRTITGRNNVSVSYETAFCSVHSPIQSSMLMMSQAAITPETQLQTASYAVALWRTELEKLYREIFEAADPVAKMVVMAEYTRFLNDIANYEAMLKLMYPDQPGQVAMKIAAMWENKCIDLCYDVHAAADERKDSLLAVTPTAGTAAAGCSCEVVSQAAGKKNEIQNYCPMHSFPFGMIDMLLQGKDTVESWGMVRQIWGVELTSAYNKLYAAMGDNKLLAMAEYEAMTQWMMAREAALTALYPDHPEIVAQIMVKTIMDRVNDLCQAVN